MKTTTPWLCALTVAIGACQRGTPPVTPGGLGARRECPKEWVWDSLGLRPGMLRVPGDTLSGPGSIQNIPEFHDCQRFIAVNRTAGTKNYGPLFAIFATFDQGRLHPLASVDSSSQADSIRAMYPNPAVVDSLLRLAFDSLRENEALPAAEIYAEGTYGPLGIGLWFNCLYLYRGEPTGWKARMVQHGDSAADCRQPVPIAQLDPGTELAVHADAVPGYAMADYPSPSARWDWDPDRNSQVLGVTCGAAWCEVGPPGFRSWAARATTMPTGVLPGTDMRVARVKGWYDQQYLAASPAEGGTAAPTEILGTIIPHPDLGTLDAVTDFEQGWVDVAYVELTTASQAANPYRTKLNLSLTPEPPYNIIALCHDGRRPCSVPTIIRDMRACGDSTWWARIQRASDGAHQYRCAKRCEVPDLVIPGMTRWRWQKNDEGMWIRCAKGCCEVLGGP